MAHRNLAGQREGLYTSHYVYHDFVHIFSGHLYQPYMNLKLLASNRSSTNLSHAAILLVLELLFSVPSLQYNDPLEGQLGLPLPSA